MEEKPVKKRSRRKDGPPKKRGPKSPWNESLGDVINAGLKFPDAVNKLLTEWEVKRLLNWMVKNASFKKKILDQVPEHDPPEPGKSDTADT